MRTESNVRQSNLLTIFKIIVSCTTNPCFVNIFSLYRRIKSVYISKYLGVFYGQRNSMLQAFVEQENIDKDNSRKSHLWGLYFPSGIFKKCREKCDISFVLTST